MSAASLTGMAHEDRRIVHPSTADWRVAAAERDLLASADRLSNWRLANQSRRYLLAVLHDLSHVTPTPTVTDPKKIPPAVAAELACIQLGAISTRSTGAVCVLTGTGYAAEAAAALRRGLEAELRMRAILADHSGEQARTWLMGRPTGSAERLAQRFGDPEALRVLSIAAHADARALRPLHQRPQEAAPVAEATLDLRPAHQDTLAGGVLYGAAYATTSFCGGLAEVFQVVVQIPEWISSELIRLRDLEASE
jgi:hypothetical protein